MRTFPALCGAATVFCGASAMWSCGSSSPSGPTPAPTKTISLQGNLAFDNVVVGFPRIATLTIVNSGNASLNVTGLTVPNGYTANWTSGAIAAGTSQNVTIGFGPTSAGSFNGTITVLSDQTSGVNSIPVSGIAFSNLFVGWEGTATFSFATSPGFVCAMSWIVTFESIAGQFSGTWTAGPPCGQGTLTGNISSADSISGLTLDALATVPPACSRVAGDGLFSGTLSGNHALVQRSETIRCTGGPDIVRSITLSMNKQ